MHLMLEIPYFRIVGFTDSNSNNTAAVVFILQETAGWYQRSLIAFLAIM